jgi:RNA polymerase sigma-70 factor (ECF subfamily)
MITAAAAIARPAEIVSIAAATMGRGMFTFGSFVHALVLAAAPAVSNPRGIILKPSDRSRPLTGRSRSDVESPELADIAVERLRRRESDAFARLVNEHERLVFGLGQSLGLRGADLDDAAAEAFAEVWMSLPKFEARSSLRTWVYRIAMRVLTRARARRTSGIAAIAHDSAEDPALNPAEQVERDEAHRRIWRAVENLDPRSAAAVELHYRQGWPLSQIAEALDCPEGTVKTILFRARESLRDVLRTQQVQP